MRVVVTRPATSGAKTAARLVALGHHPILLPLTEPLHRPQAAWAALQDRPRALVLTSSEALRAIASLPMAAYLDLPLYAVGSASAAKARKAGFTHVVEGGGTGKDLAALMISRGLQDFLYLAGSPRSPELEAELAAAGIQFRLAECYEMKPLSWDEQQRALLTPVPDAVLLYSREAARLFATQHALFDRPQAWRECRAICLSHKVASGLPAEFPLVISVADKPTEDDLLARL
ncbi:uroporphyrinogen-III synthase [Rhizobium helianthi]|uniref:Uroporphyrinogen-III synthase n=1 Tax=Rhizobium helianthi TaxID=1132695 RepID=A0ABW4M4L7_9HYPH